MEIFVLALAFSKSLMLALAAVLPILNPPASAPVFVNLTRDVAPATRRALAQRVGLNVALMLAAAMLVGTYVLAFFGVSIPVVRVAGGLIVGFTAWNMLYAQEAPDQEHVARVLQNEQRVRIQAFYPITFPLTCGPGSISAAITVGAALHHPQWPVAAVNFAGGLTAMALVSLLVTLTYGYASRLLRPLGEVGMVVFLRLSAFILLCVGVQIFWDGASELLRGLNLDTA
ncbi:MAG: NAAT family transporter [Burkholderiaceae bacterium]|jgi:multiple antibiotic resistance protein|nr:NAAT family transporter [Burkholderiaceae bacterium]